MKDEMLFVNNILRTCKVIHTNYTICYRKRGVYIMIRDVEGKFARQYVKLDVTSLGLLHVHIDPYDVT